MESRGENKNSFDDITNLELGEHGGGIVDRLLADKPMADIGGGFAVQQRTASKQGRRT